MRLPVGQFYASFTLEDKEDEMTADEVLLKKKEPKLKGNPLYPDADGKARPYPLTEVKVWDRMKKLNPRPVVIVQDLNNGSDTGNANKPKTGIGFGFQLNF